MLISVFFVAKHSALYCVEMWLYLDKRLQSDQKDINWEFLDDKELTKHGNSAVSVAMCSVY